MQVNTANLGEKALKQLATKILPTGTPIDLEHIIKRGKINVSVDAAGGWQARSFGDARQHSGATPFIAAARVLVAGNLGDVVEIAAEEGNDDPATAVVSIPHVLWQSVQTALMNASIDLDDASSVVDASEGEDYAYQDTLELLKDVRKRIEALATDASSGTPAKVMEALRHINSVYPRVTQVFYGTDQRWLYCGEAFDMPDFDEKDIDTSLLEAAVDAVEQFPAAFALDGQHE